MLLEEASQVYQMIAPVPLWFRYLVSYDEIESSVGLTLGIILALLYLIMKVGSRKHCYTGRLVCELRFDFVINLNVSSEWT